MPSSPPKYLGIRESLGHADRIFGWHCSIIHRVKYKGRREVPPHVLFNRVVLG